MKKVFLSIATVAAMVFTAQAQFKIIPKVGYMASSTAYSKAYKDDFKDNGGKIGLTSGLSAGLGFELPIGDIVAIQPEVLYTQKGEQLKGKIGGTDATSNSHINYLEIPILLKASFGEEDKLRFFTYVGPYFGYALSGKNKISVGGQSQSIKIKFGEGNDNNTLYYSSDDVNRMDIGAYIGVGASLPLGPGAVSLDARYGYGFTNFRKDDSGQASKDDLKSQNRAIGVFLGYAIPLGN